MPGAIDLLTVELVDGTRIMVPDSLEMITPYVLQEQGDWFEDEIRFLRRLVEPGATVVDVGANYGVYALSLARKVGPTGNLWAFEPASDTARLLVESAAVNGCHWLHVEQQALSDRLGKAWLLMPGQSELNKLAVAEFFGDAVPSGSGQMVEVTTLDHCMAAFAWAEVDVLKIDAEGEEERIVDGGQKFFQEFSPLVMFEVKAGSALNLNLVERFEQLGFQCFRLIPGLDALAPFSAAQRVDGYLLNLFAARPARVAALADAGWLVNSLISSEHQPGDQDLESRLPDLETMSALALSMAPRWRTGLLRPEQGMIRRALTSWLLSQDGDVSIARRYGALRYSYDLLREECKPGCPVGRWASLARVALALGEREQAIHALNVLLSDLQIAPESDLEEPFLCPDPDFDFAEPTGSMEGWLETMALAAVEKFSSFSGFYTGFAAKDRLQRMFDLGCADAAISRRLDLLQKRYKFQLQELDSRRSVRGWYDFLGLDAPLRCVDVGALSIEGKVEPWLHWAQEGFAEVLGFEPLPQACDQLNQRARNTGMAMRCLPLALGDGRLHSLHVTNEPMTSSLLPPARETIDLFPALGDLMEVEQKIPLQTHRLDDIKEVVDTDFLKLDVQGAELMILEHARQSLRSVAVVQCEVEFLELYEGQPLMADVDCFLRSQGFAFMRYAYMMGRPFRPFQKADGSFQAISQVLWADAIYVRDFRKVREWSDRQLKAAAFVLHELYEAFDLAAFFIKELDRRHATDLYPCYLGALAVNQAGL